MRLSNQRVAGRFNVHLSIYEPAGYVLRANLPQTFEQTIASLTEAMGQDPVVMQELNFTHDQKDAFLDFMNKMGNSKVYQNQAKPITARLVADCLNLANTNKVFKGVFFTVCNEGSTSCGDRVALSVNHLIYPALLAYKIS